jgi:hypothetical protein
MADSPRSLDTDGGAGAGPDRGSSTVYPGTPRWVKAFGIVVLVLALLVVGLLVAGVGGQHGPRRHLPSGDPGGAAGLAPPAAHAVQLQQA